jgi:transcription elongation factor Elf1
MPCNNCQGTMQNLGIGRVFWCPRCGSLKFVTVMLPKNSETFETPSLVKRVREIEETECLFTEKWPSVCEAAGLGAKEWPK